MITYLIHLYDPKERDAPNPCAGREEHEPTVLDLIPRWAPRVFVQNSEWSYDNSVVSWRNNAISNAAIIRILFES
jgi:hypothetical protein